ncbi:glycoside hydrolase family 15 protein [Paenarthrobacter sp. NEAU-H11]|uniref:glycoside hydrolase family 15 protein n=1 Tax=Paenarthrobacter sp. NEAU-H11 TaxID=3423924 RepID=UPI003D32EE20
MWLSEAMVAPIEDYALLSDLQTGPLVSRSGSVDWLCFPRFDSPALFSSLLGNDDHGRWLLAPHHPDAAVVDRQYLDSTFVLQTTWETVSGRVLVTDFMPVGVGSSSILRRVTALDGTIEMHQKLIIRPSYGMVAPWVSRVRDHAVPDTAILLARAGPDAVALRGPHLPQAYAHGHEGRFAVSKGETVDFELTWFPSHRVALERLRLAGGREDHFSWALGRLLLGFVENHMDDRDFGLWEMRGKAQYFTHSRVMMWAAFDCGIRAVRDHGMTGAIDHWAQLRDRLKAEIMREGFDSELNSFTQTYGGGQVDSALLVMPQVGFLAYDDAPMLGTVARLEKDLLTDGGLLLRYRTESGVDGLDPGEHPFLACSFWLVEQYARTGRTADATVLMDKLVGFSNELGLLSEEYAVKEQRMAGNFPQAFSHLALVRAADAMHGVDRLSLAVLSGVRRAGT